MRQIGQLVRVVSGRNTEGYSTSRSRYSGSTGKIIAIVQEKPALYRITTATAKEYGEKIEAGFALLVFADELRPL